MATELSESPGVVITGASRGLGFALARQILSQGPSRVVICARHSSRLQASMDSLRAHMHPQSQLFAMPCDVSQPSQVSAFARFSEDALRQNLHFWINNAGSHFFFFFFLVFV
jgi:short-subunit dehydrogenase